MIGAVLVIVPRDSFATFFLYLGDKIQWDRFSWMAEASQFFTISSRNSFVSASFLIIFLIIFLKNIVRWYKILLSFISSKEKRDKKNLWQNADFILSFCIDLFSWIGRYVILAHSTRYQRDRQFGHRDKWWKVKERDRALER